MSLRKGRVVAVHPQWGTCDLVMVDNGQRVTDVEVVGASSTSGCSWRTADVPPPSSEAMAGKVEGQLRNLVAYCATAYGRLVIMGFSRPITGLTVKEQNRWLDAHDISGSYMTFAPDGSYEVFIPGGGCLRIGTGGHQDLTSLLSAGDLPQAGPSAITVTLATSHGTLSLNPSGNWTLSGAMLNIDCNVSCTGTITAPEVIIAGVRHSTHEHGGVSTGDGKTAGPVAP